MRRRSVVAVVVVIALLLLATTKPAVAGDQARSDQTVGVTVKTPGLLAIEVDQAVALGNTPPGTSTSEVGFHIGIVNSTGDGWTVFVTSTDFESCTWECDDVGENCVPTPTSPIHTIDASNFHIRGGIGGEWAGTTEMTNLNGRFVGAGIPLLLLEGTSVASGDFDIDDPRTVMWLDVPASVPDGEYRATLTYTIMASTP